MTRESYEVAVFENKFPSFAPDTPEPEESGSVLTPTAPGRGVLYSGEHAATLAGMGEGRIRNLVEVWADRYEELGSLDFVDYVFNIEFYPPDRTADKLKYLASSETGAGGAVEGAT